VRHTLDPLIELHGDVSVFLLAGGKLNFPTENQ